MGKLVVIINGEGGVGKDTLCDFAGKHFSVRNVSAITPIKNIARQNGWNGEKDAKSRKFLADLKKLFVEYNDLPTRYLAEEYRQFLSSQEEIMFAHIREGEEIDKFKSLVETPCITLLVLRGQEGGRHWGNASDDNVGSYAYDYEYHNDKALSEAEEDFAGFLREIYHNNQP